MIEMIREIVLDRIVEQRRDSLYDIDDGILINSNSTQQYLDICDTPPVSYNIPLIENII